MHRVKAVVFDFDGVVTRLDIDWARVRRLVATIVDRPVASLLRLLEELWNTPHYELISSVIELYELDAVERAKPFPDVPHALSMLRERGIDVYMATMQSRGPVDLFLHKHGLREHFRSVFTREDCPTKRCMLRLISTNFGIPFSSMVFVDDREEYGRDSRGLGVLFLHVVNDYNTPVLAQELAKLLDNDDGT